MGTREMDFGRKEFRDLKLWWQMGPRGPFWPKPEKGGPERGCEGRGKLKDWRRA